MRAVQVHGVPDEVVEALERRAASHQRSLEGELLVILLDAAFEEGAAEELPPLRLHMAKGPTRGEWRREDMYGDDGR
jgi:plasmid stability protein